MSPCITFACSLVRDTIEFIHAASSAVLREFWSEDAKLRSEIVKQFKWQISKTPDGGRRTECSLIRKIVTCAILQLGLFRISAVGVAMPFTFHI